MLKIIFQREWIEAISDLNDELFNEISSAIIRYQSDKEINVSPTAKAILKTIFPQIDRMNTYRLNGSKGGIAKSSKVTKPNPETKKEPVEKFDFKAELIKRGAEQKHVEDWIKVRKTKKASNTETAFNAILNECSKNGIALSEVVKICAERSWTGFKYEWLQNQKQNLVVSKTESAIDNLHNLLENNKQF